MTEYAEIIYEGGANSVLAYEDEEELKNALSEIQRRALSGQPGAAQDQVERGDIDYSDPGMVHPDQAKARPAVRIRKVFLYGDEHPASKQVSTVDVDTVKELVDGMAVADMIDPEQLYRALRDEVSPTYPNNQGVHESIYKADADSEMDLDFLDEVEGT